MFVYPRVLLSLVLGGIAAEIYWLNSAESLSGWITMGIGLLTAGIIWWLSGLIFPVIHDVVTLAGTQEEDREPVLTVEKPEEEVLTGRTEIAEKEAPRSEPAVELPQEESEKVPAYSDDIVEIYHYGGSGKNTVPEETRAPVPQTEAPLVETTVEDPVMETIIYDEIGETEEDEVQEDMALEPDEEPVVLLMPNELSELGRDMDRFRVSSYRDGQYKEISGVAAMQVHLKRIALFYNDSSSFRYALTKNDEVLFSFLNRFYQFAKQCVEQNKTCVELKKFYLRYIEQLAEGYMHLMEQVTNEPAKETLRDIYKRARKLRKLMDRPFNKSFAA